ncbi:cysteine hydrolase [Rhodophyticola sp. CCM32]|uniref:cysteine hydrolase family protein n=1 Tax=Rhodophyticola sp. CCM32 TaxID=2916397 RepID=UPI00107F2CBF|nr:isochorismatase family cysteine hydrolase [Rhodophyticola sp. CCM32]QBY00812.1 cysteine hydrolase [Rhodophyticola sp. CCM32]
MNTALIVIDMQNGFLHPSGENTYPAAADIIGNVQALIAQADATGAVIVHVADRHREGFEDFEQIHLPVHSLSGSFNAAYYDGFGPRGRKREVEIVKRRYSAFFGTDLTLFLREQAVRRLILCGVKTNVCIRATAQDGFANGFEVHVVRDAVNTNRPHLGEAALEDIARYLGHVIGQSDALEMLR